MNLHYNWTLKDAHFPKNRGKVFSCFACGGGSTMGYKLAGFDVIGCNEIDPKMLAAYQANHKPLFAFLEPIQTFKNRPDLPPELFDLDILDGSPPCSSFSMAGSREDDWGKEKKFREGQADQVLDTLFFDFIDLAKRLQPKIVVAENVKGLLLGEAKDYVHRILVAFDKAGYFVRYDLLDASKMGVPQRRERVFFTAVRKDLYSGEFDDMFQTEPSLRLKFDDPRVPIGAIEAELGRELSGCFIQDWNRLKRGEEKKYIQSCLVEPDEVHPTLVSGYGSKAAPMPAWSPRWLSSSDLCKVGTFPQDYDFTTNKPGYIIGMSVPPLMMARLADQIALQWLGREYRCDTIKAESCN
jgi:DNA (cytosine-5)-methyltransferase 1